MKLASCHFLYLIDGGQRELKFRKGSNLKLLLSFLMLLLSMRDLNESRVNTIYVWNYFYLLHLNVSNSCKAIEKRLKSERHVTRNLFELDQCEIAPKETVQGDFLLRRH